MYDIIIVGAGPAGLTAALYARRAERSVLLIEKSTFGGQITHSPRVENYPGFTEISGTELADKMFEQVMAHGADIELDTVTGVRKNPDGSFTVKTEGGEFDARTVIISTGAKHRPLGIDREEEFVGEGISYCAVCDGAFYREKTVAMIGGGNSALVEANLLAEGSKKVYIVQNLGFLTGEAALANKLAERENVEIILSSVVTEIVGEKEIRAIKILNTETGEERKIELDGVFVAIGQIPENEAFADTVKLDERGYVIAGEDCTPETQAPGIFVAGDCRTKAIRQVATAAADGAVAALAACRYLDR